MATYDFNLTGLQIVKAALRKVNVLAEDEEPSNSQMEIAAEALNLAVKALQNDGVFLWTYEEATLDLVQGQSKYALSDRVLSVANVVTQRIQSVAGGSAVTGNLKIGTGATVTALAQGTTSFTVASANTTAGGGSLTVTAAGAWSYTPPSFGSISADLTETFTYTITYAGATTAAGSFSVTTAATAGNTDAQAEVALVSRGDWASIPDRAKLTENQPCRCYFNPVHETVGTATGPTLSFYEIPDQSYLCTFWQVRKLADFDNLYADSADVWQRWLDALIYSTAARLADDFGLDLNRCQWLQQKADEFLRRARGGTNEKQDSHILRSCY